MHIRPLYYNSYINTYQSRLLKLTLISVLNTQNLHLTEEKKAYIQGSIDTHDIILSGTQCTGGNIPVAAFSYPRLICNQKLLDNRGLKQQRYNTIEKLNRTLFSFRPYTQFRLVWRATPFAGRERVWLARLTSRDKIKKRNFFM